MYTFTTNDPTGRYTYHCSSMSGGAGREAGARRGRSAAYTASRTSHSTRDVASASHCGRPSCRRKSARGNSRGTDSDASADRASASPAGGGGEAVSATLQHARPPLLVRHTMCEGVTTSHADADREIAMSTGCESEEGVA